MKLQRFEERYERDGRKVRFTNFWDAESLAFEAELERDSGIELPMPQRHIWIQENKIPYFLFQFRDASGAPKMQAVVHIERSNRLPWIAHGLTPKLGCVAEAIHHEQWGLNTLKFLCKKAGLSSLRLQPLRKELLELWDFEARARRCGFELSDPTSVTRTLLLDLSPAVDEIHAAFPQKTRAKLRHATKEQLEMRVLTDAVYAEACYKTMCDSRERTQGGTARFDFASAIRLSMKNPDRVRVVGLFLKHRPNELLAHVVGLRHGSLAECISAGSAPDDELRKIPFNYFLFWNLMTWAKENGSSRFDLGGVTDGHASDRLAGISRFKRGFDALETEIGREMLTSFQPTQLAVIDFFKRTLKVA